LPIIVFAQQVSVRDHGDCSQGMTAASPRFLSLTELNLDVAEISRPMSLPHLNTRPRACDLTCADGEPAVRRDTYDEDATLPICMKDLCTRESSADDIRPA
jgi:hypothetical protein